MRQMETSTRLWKQALAALGVLAGLALAPAPAQAQICGDFEDLAEDLLDAYFEEFEDFFTLSANTCDSMKSTFAKACDTAVKDAVKCAQNQIKALPKAGKPACKENFENPSDCDQNFKNEAELANNIVSLEANDAKQDCEIAADDFWDVCRFGIGN